MSDKLHECRFDYQLFIQGGHGVAVGVCIEREDGYLWVDNGEYANTVNFCPYCGYKAKNQALMSEAIPE